MDHLQAARIVENVLTKVLGRVPTPNERALMQGVAWLESNYGRASGQHKKWADLGLYTWGNIEKGRNPDGSCDEGDGWYPGSDAGNLRCFKLDKTDEAAAERYIKTMISAGNPNGDARSQAFYQRSQNIRAALKTGDPVALATAMTTPKSVAYFEAAPATYAAGLRNSLAAIDKVVPRAVVNAGKPSPSPVSPVPSGEGLPTESGTSSSARDVDKAALALAKYITLHGTKTTYEFKSEVLKFQRAYSKLVLDGVYGPKTAAALAAQLQLIAKGL